MGAMASQITGVSIVCSTVGSDGDRKKHKSSASLAFVRGIHQWPVKSPHKRPVTRKMYTFDDVIMVPHVGDKTHDNDIIYILLWAFYMSAYCTMDSVRLYSPILHNIFICDWIIQLFICIFALIIVIINAMNWLDGPKYLNKSVISAYLLFIDGMNIFILELMSKHIVGDYSWAASLQWRHNEHDSVSNHQAHHCLLNHLFRRRSKIRSKLRITGLCVRNSPVTDEFPAQRARNTCRVHHKS